MREKQSYFVKSDYGIYDTDVQPTTRPLDVITEVAIEASESVTLENVDKALEESGEQIRYKNNDMQY